MATPKQPFRPSADRLLVKRFARRTDHLATARVRSDRWHQSKAIRAKVKDLVPRTQVRPAGRQPTVAATRKRLEGIRATLRSNR